VLLTGFYLALVTEHDWPEIVIAVVSGAVGAAAAIASGTAERGRYSPAWRWLAWVGPLPLQVCADTGRLAVRLGRRALGRPVQPGATRELELFRGDDGARSRARRAIGGWVLSYSPGTYVVDVDTDTGTVLVHDLGGSGSSPVEKRLSA
jgi:multisubunit Na+/H+ antiporter MnhE subunit